MCRIQRKPYPILTLKPIIIYVNLPVCEPISNSVICRIYLLKCVDQFTYSPIVIKHLHLIHTQTYYKYKLKELSPRSNVLTRNVPLTILIPRVSHLKPLQHLCLNYKGDTNTKRI